MTITTSTTTGTTGTTNPATAGDPVARFLDAVTSGDGIPAGIFSDDATLDATVPMWRLEANGADAVRGELGKWYGLPATLEHVAHRPFPGGDAVEIDLSWHEAGVPHAAHQLHVLAVEGDRIVSDTVFCGGRWPAALLAEMEAARAH